MNTEKNLQAKIKKACQRLKEQLIKSQKYEDVLFNERQTPPFF